MPAMHNDVMENMVSNLNSMKDRMINLVPFDLTHDECIELVAEADHIPILKGAAKYAELKASVDWMSLCVPWTIDGETNITCVLQMRTYGEKEPPLRPRVPMWQPNKSGGAKVIEWLTKRLELGRRFGLAHHVLHTLNDACDTGAQMRYLWPPVMHLTKLRNINNNCDQRTKRWAEKYAGYKPQRYCPAVTPAMKAAIQDTSALLTSAVLMGEEVRTPEIGEVEIDCWSLPWFDHGGQRVLRQ